MKKLYEVFMDKFLTLSAVFLIPAAFLLGWIGFLGLVRVELVFMLIVFLHTLYTPDWVKSGPQYVAVGFALLSTAIATGIPLVLQGVIGGLWWVVTGQECPVNFLACFKE